MPQFNDPLILQNVIEFGASRTPDVAPSGKARLWYDQSAGIFKLSVSGGDYAEVPSLLAGSLSAADLAAIADGAITAVKLEEGVQRITDVTISSAELLALNAAPKTLIAAPGASKAIIFDGAVLYHAAGTAYAAIAAGEDLSFKYTNGSGLEVAACETTGFLDQATAQMRYVLPRTGALAAGTVSDITPVANAALVAQLLSGEITTGDYALLCRVYHRIVPTVLT